MLDEHKATERISFSLETIANDNLLTQITMKLTFLSLEINEILTRMMPSTATEIFFRHESVLIREQVLRDCHV